MPDDDKTAKPNPPTITADEVLDPSDAFARVKVDPSDKSDNPKDQQKKSKDRKKKGDAPREPKIEKDPPPPEDDDAMDPFDAAEEIIGLADNLFAAAAAIRGYDKIVLPNGEPMLPMVIADDKSKERLKKALARVMKSAGAVMSPGAALAFAAFGCYGAPIIGLEIARASATKKPA